MAETAKFFARYIALPDEMLLVASAWTTAAWLSDAGVWDRFPHLAITSPEKRCGKTRLLQLLEQVTPNPFNTSNISPAAVYRLIELKKPTLLLDEAQSISRRGSEASEVIRELFNAGIDKNAKVIRCGGEGKNEIETFSVYSPKVIALIGDLDGVLADRCLPITMKRKTDADVVEQYRSRIVGPVGEALREKLRTWTADNKENVAKVYDHLEPFPIANDRMAELLMPLQAVLEVVDKERLPVLQGYAEMLDQKDREAGSLTGGKRDIRLH